MLLEDIFLDVFFTFYATDWSLSLWRHQMEKFSALLPLYAGDPPVISGFSSLRDRNADLWCFFGASINKLLNKHSIDRWFETPWGSFDVAETYHHFIDYMIVKVLRNDKQHITQTHFIIIFLENITKTIQKQQHITRDYTRDYQFLKSSPNCAAQISGMISFESWSEIQQGANVKQMPQSRFC